MTTKQLTEQESAQKKFQDFLEREGLEIVCQGSVVSKNNSTVVIEDALDFAYQDKDKWVVTYGVGVKPKNASQ